MMNTIRNIQIISQERYLITHGLKKFIDFELSVLTQIHDESEYIKLLSYLIDYIIDNKPQIKADQTITYHSWLLKFIIDVDSRINIHELTSNGNGFVEGADYSIKVVIDQINECNKHNAAPLFPTFSQMIVVSKGVLDNDVINAVRYPSPTHMTGWWLTTDLYDGDVKSLQTIHYYHVAFKRSDIMRYLALPPGFRFYAADKPDVWFDSDVLV
ncbi:hypothetical protein HQ865_13875 [Mucilaginibacter mali]|uniref:Imm33-like domain-containing protein n=1 Tax=Mucilaginibacter mali TaxID=2740462 RepID=A0A7D4Q8K9_9SPHI|nr:hypothetical protein [Mucilaginibacter mali]QKJ30791.1 hypothetical protein HQ865_13875 [Mucilaginibacter mali]